MFLPLNAPLVGLLSGFLVAVLVGLADDIWQIKPLVKLMGQIVSASVFLIVSGVSITHFGDLFGFGNVVLGWWGMPITVFTIVAVMNAMNLADGLW